MSLLAASIQAILEAPVPTISMEQAANRLPFSPRPILAIDPLNDDCRGITPEELRSVLAGSQQLRESVLMVEDIDGPLLDAIKTTLPGEAGTAAFLHRHAARLHVEEYGDPTPWPYNEVNMKRKLLRSPKVEGAEVSCGLHFDGLTVTRGLQPADLTNTLSFLVGHYIQAGDHSDGLEAIVRDDQGWTRASTRISCCLLKPELYLILVDAPLKRLTGFLDGATEPWNRPGLPTPSPSPTLDRTPYIRREEVTRFHSGLVLQRALKNFSPRHVLQFMSGNAPMEKPVDALFHYLLTVSEWQVIVDDLDYRLRRLQEWSIHSPEKATLSDLGMFRRAVVKSSESIALSVKHLLHTTGMTTSRDVSSNRSRSERAPATSEREIHIPGTFRKLDTGRSTHFGDVHHHIHIGNTPADGINAAMLLNRLSSLEERLEVIAKTVNEEIQLFIASVSVRDSEVILEDSKVMKKQATRATLLTTLAAIYLPLQLVTGIFGMNIREIAGEGPVGYRSPLIAFVVAAVSTILVFIGFWSWRRWKRHILDFVGVSSWQRWRDSERKRGDTEEGYKEASVLDFKAWRRWRAAERVRDSEKGTKES